jgi:hypothetical protein
VHFVTATELSLLRHAIETTLVKAVEASRLESRAAQALAIMVEKGEANYTNESLRKIFLDSKLSSEKSVQKDSSGAKSDLLDARCVQTEGKVSIFSVTDHGRKVAALFNAAMQASVEEVEKVRRIGAPDLQAAPRAIAGGRVAGRAVRSSAKKPAGWVRQIENAATLFSKQG